MKIPPKKPHFFKPILPGFNDGIKIPTSFFKYLGGKSYHQALLRRGGKEWRVKVNDQFFREGWSRFASENNLDLRDVVVFKHEGNMVFEVLVFDRSQCEREDPAMDDEDWRNNADLARDDEGMKEVLLTPKRTEFSLQHEETDYPHFMFNVKPYMINWSFLYLPMKFARSNGLSGRRCKIILRDPQERSWHLNLKTKSGYPYIRRGSTLKELFAANGLKEGDSFKCELVENGETPILNLLTNFGVDQRPETEAEAQAKPPAQPQPRQGKGKSAEASTEYDCGPYFVSTIMPYSMRKRYLSIPLKFARSNGLLEKREMILRDNRQRSWVVRLNRNRYHFRISSGWPKFRNANGIKEGDTCRFQIIKKGKIPLVDFRVLYN